MIKFSFTIFFLLVLSLRSNSMSIKGPVLTRYDPCAIGVLYFDKITDKVWQGVVNIGMYHNVQHVEIEVAFKRQTIIYGASVNSTISAQNQWHDFTIKPKGELPKIYNFYILINENNPENIPTVTKLKLNNVTLCDETIKLSQTIASLNVTKENESKTYSHICGRRSLDHAELTSLRTDSKTGDWPWHVAIMIEDPVTKNIRYQCGGNIISKTAILTAGHCLFSNGIAIPANKITVHAGVTYLKDLTQAGRQTFTPKKTILHPAYNHSAATSDLAIIIVNQITFTEYVQPICIWGPVYDKTALFGKEAVVVGFGTTEQDRLSDTLRTTNIMVQNDATCLAFAQHLYKPLLNEFTFCAGYGPNAGINPRNGDSGGGLVVPTMQTDFKISWFLRGVLSKCGVNRPNTPCDPNYYVVYTDVGPHYSWIYHNSGLFYRSNIVS
ncbi:serine protease 27-like [Epargyreus clarus]|uniref:serine protease 27-like n=1 Tax=Epargyreus clarus TaxID=520877 RepID=UPI003C2BAAB2